MPRAYPGIDLSIYGDARERRNMKAVDLQLRDLRIKTTGIATAEQVVGAPNNLSYVTVNAEDQLSQERQLIANAPIILSDIGPDSTVILSLNIEDPIFDRFLRADVDDTGVGAYTLTNPVSVQGNDVIGYTMMFGMI